MASSHTSILFRMEVKLASGKVVDLPVTQHQSGSEVAAAFAEEHSLPVKQQQALQRSIEARLLEHHAQQHNNAEFETDQVAVQSNGGSALSHAESNRTVRGAGFDSEEALSTSRPDSPSNAASRKSIHTAGSKESINTSTVQRAATKWPAKGKTQLVDVSSKRLHDASVAGVLSLLCANANEGAVQPLALTVDMQYNNVSSVSQVAKGLPLNVCELRAGHNNLSGDLSPLVGLSNLHTLKLPGNALTKLTGLSMATQLMHLDISSNRVVSLSGLEALRSLRSVDARHNMIGSLPALRPLSHCPQLQEVFLAGNPICPAGASSSPAPPSALEGAPSLEPAVRKYRSRVLALLSTLTSLDGLPTAPSPTRYRGSPRGRTGGALSSAAAGASEEAAAARQASHSRPTMGLKRALAASSAPVGAVSKGSARRGEVPALGAPSSSGTPPPSAAQAAAAAASTATSAALAAIDAATARRKQALAVVDTAQLESDAERDESPRSAPRPHRSSPPVSGAIKTYHPAALGSRPTRRPGATRVTPSGGGVSGYAQRRAAAAAALAAAPPSSLRSRSKQREGQTSAAQQRTPRSTAHTADPHKAEAEGTRESKAPPPQYSTSPPQRAQPRYKVVPPKLHTSQRAVARDPHGQLRAARERAAGDAGYAVSQHRAKAQTRHAQAQYKQLVSGRKDGFMHETAAWTQRKGVHGGGLSGGGSYGMEGGGRYASSAAAAALNGSASHRDTASLLSQGDAPVLGMRDTPTPLTPGDMRLRSSQADAVWMGMLRAPSNARAPPPATYQHPGRHSPSARSSEGTLHDAEPPPHTPQAPPPSQPQKTPGPLDAELPSPVQAEGATPAGHFIAAPPTNPFDQWGGSPQHSAPPSPTPDSSGAPSFIHSFVSHLPMQTQQHEEPPQASDMSSLLHVPAVGQFGQAVAAAAAAATSGVQPWPQQQQQQHVNQHSQLHSAGAPIEEGGLSSTMHPYGELLDTSGVSAATSAWGTPARNGHWAPHTQPPAQPPHEAARRDVLSGPTAAAPPRHQSGRGGGAHQKAKLRSAMGDLLATKQKLMATLGRA